MTTAILGGGKASIRISAAADGTLDIAQQGAATGQALVWSGAAWAPGTISGGGAAYTLPAMTSTSLGGGKASARISAAADGTLDIAQQGAATGQALVWSGAAWTPGTISGGGVSYTLPAMTSTSLGGGKASTRISAAGDGTLDLAQQGAATGQALVWSGVAWAPGTVSGGSGATKISPVAYTAAGAISTSDAYSQISSASAVAMTLPLGSSATDGVSHSVSNIGAGTVTLSLTLDGSNTTVTIVQHAIVNVFWNNANNTYYLAS